MKYPDYNHKELEPEMLEFWKNQKILKKLKDKNENGKKFTFLQGPPYTSGRIHLGHAWNYALKDMALRYKRSQGFNVWDRNGYDVHGLPTAHKVMAENNLKTKEDIENFGVGKFIKGCEEYAKARAATMDDDFKRIGCTINFDDPYMAMNNNYMEGEWWLVKQAWKKDRLYLGDKSMTWCGNCETALAKHECEYQELVEDSIFLKFPIKGKENEFLIIWTTTPWTIPFNLAIMVNPNLDYVKAKVAMDDGDEVWVIGKSLVGPLVQSVVGKALTIVNEFKGQELLGTEYLHPWENDIPQFKEIKEKHHTLHTVILSEQHVDFTAGSGLVHCAPGCGPEDQVVGKEYGLPAFNNLTEKGEFPKEIGERFAGRIAKVDDKKFIEDMEKDGFLIATTKVEHDYPTCWRCHKPVIFKTTKQWFFKIEDLRVEMIQENAKVNWVPKTQAFDSWTSNLKDNSITRQRYWGTPVPLWKCTNEECEEIEVIGSVKELAKKVGKENIPEDLHRPWIDNVKWKCKCGGTMKRIPDILDVWIDAGTASWNCLYYPQEEEYFIDNFPADLVLEATEQVRLWFSMLSICSQLALGKNCYKNLYMHGMIRDVDGTKMSKSIGNIISPDEMIKKHGADVLRYYMCQTNAGQDIKFSWDEATLKGRHLLILWNTHKFLINLCEENKINPVKIDKSIVENVLGIEEKYILSKLNYTLKKVTELFEEYRLDETIAPLEELFLELSRTYIQMVRDKCALGEEQEKEVAIYTIFNVLMEFLKAFNIISPFITEAIYQNLKDEFGLKELSIMHYKFPKADEQKINLELEQSVEASKQIVQSVLNAREKAKLGLRWPVKEIVIVSKNQEVVAAVEKMRDIIQKQVNTQSINILDCLPGVTTKIKCDPGKIGKAYGQLTPEIVTKLTIDSPETIIGHLEKESVYNFSIGNQEVKITRDMIIIERDVPEIYQESEFKYGQIYLNKERTEELEAEGYSREVMRNIQQLRKQAGLEKLDSIVLLLKVSKEMKRMLEPFKLEIKKQFGRLDFVKRIEIAGSFRRGKETIGDLDFLVVSDQPQKVINLFTNLPDRKQIIAKGETKSSIRLDNGLQIDLRVVKEKEFGSAMNYFTGNKQHNIILRKIALSKGYSLSEYGLFKLSNKDNGKDEGNGKDKDEDRSKKWIAGKSEEQIYQKLGMPYIEPELRENTGEITAAQNNKLPKLVTEKDVKGIFHTHTDWSDGSNSILEMAQKAEELGLKFISFNDHYGDVGIANPLNEKRLTAYLKEIEKVKKQVKIKVYSGIEIDILKDGTLPLSKEKLKKLDIVIAAVHLATRMSEPEMTKRVCYALDNYPINILGHPTDRLLNHRPEMNMNLEKVFTVAKKNNVFIEINSSPERMDLDGERTKAAIKAGCKLAIGTDAHDLSHLNSYKQGIIQARRGWAEGKDLLNCYNLNKIEKLTKKTKSC